MILFICLKNHSNFFFHSPFEIQDFAIIIEMPIWKKFEMSMVWYGMVIGECIAFVSAHSGVVHSKTLINRQWQTLWSETHCRLKDFKPTIGDWKSSYRDNRVEEKV